MPEPEKEAYCKDSGNRIIEWV